MELKWRHRVVPLLLAVGADSEHVVHDGRDRQLLRHGRRHHGRRHHRGGLLHRGDLLPAGQRSALLSSAFNPLIYRHQGVTCRSPLLELQENDRLQTLRNRAYPECIALYTVERLHMRK